MKKINKLFRILKLRFLYGYMNCENCGKFTNKITSIPYIEAGLLVCHRCDKIDLNNE